MAKITRKLQKVFASGAGATGITEYGSPATGTPVYTTDLDDIQSLAAWDGGWSSAALAGSEIPTFQDFNALMYTTTNQIKYIMQEGLCEYLSTETYFTNSVVKKSGTYELYGSKINDNIGNALPSQVDDANWEYLGLVGGGGALEKATQAQVEAFTLDKNITSDNAAYIKGRSKAGVLFDGKLGVTIAESENVTSVVRNSVGDYTVTFTDAFATANYRAVAMVGDAFSPNVCIVQDTSSTPTTTTFTFTIREASSAVIVDADYISLEFFGDLA